MSAKHNFPTTTGIYWARMSRIGGWYRLIVCVGGEAPFLRVLWALDFITDGPVKVNPYDLYTLVQRSTGLTCLKMRWSDELRRSTSVSRLAC